MVESIALNSDENNVRPYGIFIAYMATCLSLAIIIIIKLLQKAEKLNASTPSLLPRRRHVSIFAILAVCSLFSTWSFMFRYFQWSYNNWLTVRLRHDLDPSVMHWGLWLKETSLFREAWESVIIGHNRYWWSNQIFHFAAALGLHSEWKGVRHGISYTWAFMLLGQIVAISFATNLYFLTLLLSPRQQQPAEPRSKAGASGQAEPAPVSGYSKWLGPWLIDAHSVFMTSASAYVLSWDKYQNGAPGVMQILLLPHVTLMILPTLRAVLPSKSLPLGETMVVNKIYNFLWIQNFHFVGQLIWSTYRAFQTGTLGDILNALLEHPAVSSVGFDVIFCWLSWMCWWRTQDDNLAVFTPRT